ncbi:MAG: type II secretion system F family protein [Planctomycetaceae bacterium]|jgi:type II secretory pathway component PulF|nr:type II secretion system F family protein [Planctomycetaceae bacterium]
MIQHDQLIGLCDEIAALVRLNLPLETALRYRSGDLPVRLGNRVRELADRLESGQLLSEALRKDPNFPPVYAAVIEAGLESGNLTGALEQIAQNLRILRDSRNFLQGAMLYPMFVFTVLWFLFSIVATKCLTVFIDFYHSFSFKLSYLETLALILNPLNQYRIDLGLLIVPVLLWGVFIFWCVRSKRSTLLTLRTPPLFFWLRNANRNLTQTAFAQIVTMLIRSGLPLPRTLLLAFQTVGISVSESELEQQLHSVKNRQPQPSSSKKLLPLNHLVNWIFSVSDQTVLLSGLDQYAELHKFQAENYLKRLEFWLPVLLLFLLGGIIFAAYFLAIIFPYGYLLYQLSGC